MEGLRPPAITPALRRTLVDVEIAGGPDDPRPDDGWGEPGLSSAEKLFAWNTLEVLASDAMKPLVEAELARYRMLAYRTKIVIE